MSIHKYTFVILASQNSRDIWNFATRPIYPDWSTFMVDSTRFVLMLCNKSREEWKREGEKKQKKSAEGKNARSIHATTLL